MGSKSNGNGCATCSLQIGSPSVNNERVPLLRPSSHPGDSLYPNIFFIGCLMVFLLIGTAAGTYLLLNEEKWQMSGVYSIVSRKSWGARKAEVDFARLQVPVWKVVLVDTGSANCRTKSQCISVVRDLQEQQMRTQPDIAYNFLVGGDGRVYEGRGWNYAVKDDTNSLIIALIGSFGDVKPSKSQQVELEILVQVALNTGVVDDCYTVAIPEDRGSNQMNMIDLAIKIQRKNQCFPKKFVT